MTDDILREDREGIIILTLNRAAKRNAMTIAMRQAIFDAVDDLRDDPELKVLLLRSNSPFFTAGIDIVEHVQHFPNTRTMQVFRRDYRRNIHRFFDEMEMIEKPVVMAINGPCLGIGLEMAGAVDFRLASTEARFGLPEVDLGMIAGSGGTSRLVRLIGVGWTKWLGMAGEPMDAQTALTAGLVQAVYQPEAFEDQVWAFCQRLAAKDADAVGVAKLAIDLCKDLDRQGGRTVERLANTPLSLRDNSARIANRLKTGGKK
ncbi:enoyl-CoA hydratase/isomerase family protein [Novosphingobium bradum]|uniref:Enoyl-CoA hydratase/isomerase family protein n=1 Tax=Novosphingobium bradum TaxID=1737444 RepID=A0ABV7IJ91_9SPHN